MSASVRTPESGLPQLQVVPESIIRFTPISNRVPRGSTASDVTRYSLDSAHALDATLAAYRTADGILGEIQFSFVCFLIGQVADAFDQWKRLVHLLCSSESSVVKRPDFYRQFISILYYHVREIPRDFFVDIVSRDNFLVSTLHGLFLALEGDAVDRALQRRGRQFKEHLTKKFKWNFSEEPEDEAPVVVELPE